MEKINAFRLLVLGWCVVILFFAALADVGLLKVSWVVLFAAMSFGAGCAWKYGMEDADDTEQLQRVIDTPETTEEEREQCRREIKAIARSRRRLTLKYWRREWIFWPRVDLAVQHVTSRTQVCDDEDPVTRDAREWRCSREVAMKLHHLDKHVNEMVHCGVMRRLHELEERERWRTAKEWFALRDEWRTLANDPAIPADRREIYKQWLSQYSEEPPIVPRYFS